LGAFKPLFVAIVFSAYSFIGFEGAASYAEETSNPRRNIPIGIFAGVILIGVVYVFSSWTTALAFPSAAAIAKSASPYLTVGSSYWGAGVLLVYLAGFTSIAANIMAAGNANVRILFNGAREGIFFKKLSHVHGRQRTPDYATVTFLGSCLALSLVASIWWSPLVIYALWSGIGALLAIVAYLASNIGVAVYYFRVWRGEFSWFTHGLVPVIALAVWGYTLYTSLKPNGFPSTAYPWGIGGGIVLSLGFLFYKMRTDPQSIERIGDITSDFSDPDSPTLSPRK
jgi:amino acid transporter